MSSAIIIAWEYERDTSHISRLKHLQKQLKQIGHQVYLVGSSLPALEDSDCLPFISSPKAPAPAIHKPRAVTKMGGYGDRLALLGFNNARILANLVASWDTIFELINPRLLICDCAPVASLAAYKHIPSIQLSDALSLPPSHLADFPRLRPDAPPLASTHDMLKNVHAVQSRRKKELPPYLPAILQSEYSFISHIPELDPYQTFRSGNGNVKSGPFLPLPSYSIRNEKDYFFAYLKMDYPDIEEIIIGLSDLDKKGIFYIPGAPYGLQEYLVQSGMIVCQAYPVLNEVLKNCAFTIHHGDIVVAEAALAAGIPQFVLPNHFESNWVGHYLEQIGVGVSFHPALHPIAATKNKIENALMLKTAEKIKRSSNKQTLREWADLRAQHFLQKKYEPIEAAIMDACRAILQ